MRDAETWNVGWVGWDARFFEPEIKRSVTGGLISAFEVHPSGAGVVAIKLNPYTLTCITTNHPWTKNHPSRTSPCFKRKDRS